MLPLVTSILALSPAARPLPRRAILGGAVAAWSYAPQCEAFAPSSDGKVTVLNTDPIEKINERRALVGLAPLPVPPKGDGKWAEHQGAFTESFFDTSFKKRDDGFIYKKITSDATGEKPQNGQSVYVYYTGYLEDGTKFDSAYDKGTPFEFRLGKGKVIGGWEAVVSGMQVGEKVIIKIPPQFAYGDKQVGPIPPNSNLIFFMELVLLGDKTILGDNRGSL